MAETVSGGGKVRGAMPRAGVRLLVALAVLLVLSRFAALERQAFHHDESIHCLYSWKIAHESLSTYRYSPVYHGPFLYFWGALGQRFLPDTDYFARVPYALAGVLAVLFLLAWRKMLGWGGVATLMALLVLSAPINYFSRFARNDVYQMAWMAGQIVGVVLYLRGRRLRYLTLAALCVGLSYCTKENSYVHHFGLCAFPVMWALWRFARYRGQAIREAFDTYLPLTRLLVLIGCVSFFAFLYVAVDCRVSPETGLGQGMANIARNLASDKDKSGAEVFAGESGYFTKPGREAVRGAYMRLAFGATLALLVFAEGLGVWLRRRRLRGHWILWGLWACAFYGLLTWFVGSMARWVGHAPGDRFVAALMMQAAWRLVLLTAVAMLPAAAEALVGWCGEAQGGVERRLPGWAVGNELASLALQVFLVVFVYLLLFTSLGSNAPGGARDGLYEYLSYWFRHQTGEHRIWGVRWYYVPRLMLFEAMPLMLTGLISVGLILRAKAQRKSARPRKVALPHTVEPRAPEEAESSPWRPVHPALLCFAAWLAFFLILVYAFLNEKVTWLLTYQSFAVNLLAGLLITHWMATRRQRGGRKKADAIRRITDLALLGLLVLFCVWQHIASVYMRPDRGANLLVYTGTTHQFGQEMGRIEKLRLQAGREGRRLRIGVHGEAEWPCAWYFRSHGDYHRHLDVIWKTIDLDREIQIMDVSSENLRRVGGRKSVAWDVRTVAQRGWWHWAGDTSGLPGGDNLWRNVGAFLVNKRNDQSAKFREGDYQGSARSDAKGFMMQVLSYVFLRRVWYPTAYAKVLVCYRTGKAPAPETLPAQLKGADAPARPVKALALAQGQGADPGLFVEPRGVDVFTDGRIAVADSKNGRIQIFDADGKHIADVGKGTLNADYSGPCDVAWGHDGSLYVADTWNHAIHRFDAGGNLLTTAKQANRAGAQVGLWGPRGIAVGGNGRVYVTDTGNKYVCVYDEKLQPLSSFGGPGADRGFLSEPVGIAVDSYNRVWVADTGNGRIQLFDSSGRFQADYQTVVALESERVGMEPHLAVLPDGRLAATYSLMGQVWLIDPSKQTALVLRISEPALAQPLGVACDAQGALYVAGRKSAQLVKLTPPPVP